MNRPRKLPRWGTPRGARLLEHRIVRERLIPVAGLVGRPVRLPDGRDVGRVVDVVVRWDSEQYPAATGMVVKVGRRRVFTPAEHLADVAGTTVVLSSPQLDVRDFERRPGEAVLMHDVVDHQLVDIDGVQVIRAADLYLARVAGALRLVGVETGALSLLRRLGPARLRARATPQRVIDWAAVRPLSSDGAGLQLRRSAHDLRRLRPGDVADLLEQLGRPQRQELLAALDPELAADALEEMDTAQRDALLRESAPQDAAALIAHMEPDEAAEALRELDDDERTQVIALLPVEQRAEVGQLLTHDEDTAGGMMTTRLVIVPEHARVHEAVAALRVHDAHPNDIDGVLVVDATGRLVDDLSLFELLVAEPDAVLSRLVGPPWPIVVGADVSVDEVVDAVLSNRRTSVLVVDEDGRPLGRVLLDDVLDAVEADVPVFRRDRRDRSAS